ncbi:MAG: hypothetical protein ACOX5Z_03070 [Desulfobulbus sp.]|jgi:sodium/proline symporter
MSWNDSVVLTGIITGVVTVLVWKQANWLGLYEIVPGFLFGGAAIVLFSLLGAPPSASVVARFNKVKEELARI